MLRLVALAALIAVGSATTAKLELQLLAQAADCQTVNIPASDVVRVAAFWARLGVCAWPSGSDLIVPIPCAGVHAGGSLGPTKQ